MSYCPQSQNIPGSKNILIPPTCILRTRPLTGVYGLGNYFVLCMQEIRSPNPPVVTGIWHPNKSRARHHRNKFLHMH